LPSGVAGMKCHRLLVLAGVTLGLVGGCASENVFLPAPAQVSTRETAKPSPVARPQKEDSPPITRTNLLDVLPEVGGDNSGEVAARIVATVNGVPVFEEEVQAAAYQFMMQVARLPEPERSIKRREVFKDSLDQLIERELMIQDAENRLKKHNERALKRLHEAANKQFDRRWVKAMRGQNGGMTDDQLKESLHQQGLSLDMIRRQWTRQFMSTEYLRSRIMPQVDQIGHEDLTDYYESHPEDFKVDDSVEWQDIFINASRFPSREAARQFAEQLARRAETEDFVALSDQHNDGLTKLQKAEGIGRKRGEIEPPEAEQYLFRMPEGKVGPVLDLGNGFHVIRLVKREFAGKKPFDDTVQKQIRNKLRAEVFAREAKKIMADLKRKAIIEYARIR
jgi:peptidyl-prolyl cis-trans isomerase SurA